MTAMQIVAAPFASLVEIHQQDFRLFSYPKEHDRWKEDRGLGFGEDQVGWDFEQDVLETCSVSFSSRTAM